MLPNMKETKGTHCGLFGMKKLHTYARTKKPENGWCSNCIHENTAFCHKAGNCCANMGLAPTGYIPVKDI